MQQQDQTDPSKIKSVFYNLSITSISYLLFGGVKLCMHKLLYHKVILLLFVFSKKKTSKSKNFISMGHPTSTV